MKWRTPQLPASALLDHLGGPHAACARLGVHVETAYRWNTNGRTFTVWQADMYATRAGVHPAEVWPVWYTLADKVLEGQQ